MVCEVSENDESKSVGVKFMVALCKILLCFLTLDFVTVKFHCCICGIEALHNSLYFCTSVIVLVLIKGNNLKRCVS